MTRRTDRRGADDAAGATAPDSALFDRAAGPVRDFVAALRDERFADESALCDRAEAHLAAFAQRGTRSGIPVPQIAPARHALALTIDRAVRRLDWVNLSRWSAISRIRLFDGHDITEHRVQEFAATARQHGAAFAGLAGFLDQLLAREDRRRRGGPHRRSAHWGWVLGGSVALLLAGLAGYAGFLEYRFQTRLISGFQTAVLDIGLDQPRSGSDLVVRLDRLAQETLRVRQAMAGAPLRGALVLPLGDSGGVARQVYLATVAAQVPPVLDAAIKQSMAIEGDNLALYDTLRAWSVLSGQAGWDPAYLAGWVQSRAAEPGLQGLAAHVAALSGPPPWLEPPDPQVADIARSFAAATDEPSRAWLELLRSQGAAALPGWLPVQVVPGLADIVVRRSGTDIATPVPGIFTEDGWTYARDIGAGVAVQQARDAARQVFGQPLQQANDSPDRVMERLQHETIAYWHNWLNDLRVRPFDSQGTGVLVSGLLAQNQSPLTALLAQVWQQVGGRDRTRTHAQQLELATEFGAMIQYVETGQMAQIADLFAGLNVALGTLDVNAERGAERLMSVQDRARSIAALTTAPQVVVQIVEDTLAQAGGAQTSDAADPLVRRWQTEVFPLCHSLTGQLYPFRDGPDANFADVTALLGPRGALAGFFASQVAPYIDRDSSPWRWKPEARFAGLSPESAAFFQRAAALTEALFDSAGGIGTSFDIAALAERGQTLIAVGGAAVPVRASGEAQRLAWPGPDPALGVEVRFQDGPAASQLGRPGPWGLLRMLDGLRLRPRDGGKRFLIDLRDAQGRIFVEMTFADAANPVSARALLKDFKCPPAL